MTVASAPIAEEKAVWLEGGLSSCKARRSGLSSLAANYAERQGRLPLFYFFLLPHFVPQRFQLGPSELQLPCRVRLSHLIMICLRNWRRSRLTVLSLLLGSSLVSAQSASTTSAASSAATNSFTASSTSSSPITHTVDVALVRIGDLQPPDGALS
jgi:hypothetical protein